MAEEMTTINIRGYYRTCSNTEAWANFDVEMSISAYNRLLGNRSAGLTNLFRVHCPDFESLKDPFTYSIEVC